MIAALERFTTITNAGSFPEVGTNIQRGITEHLPAPVKRIGENLGPHVLSMYKLIRTLRRIQ